MEVTLHDAEPRTAATRSAWRRRIASRLAADARIYQIAFQAILLTIGVLVRDFALDPQQMLLAFAAGLATQRVWLNALRLESKGVLSAVITCLGVSLLLRADTLWVHPLAAALAISSKFVLRINGKHVFNPANLGVVAAVALQPGTWVSPGQWGTDVALAVGFVALGGLVTERARRFDISSVFLAAWAALVAARVLWLGQPWTIFIHQFTGGALLLFAFFMISDPMTIPNRRSARIGYAIIVALLAFGWQFVLFRTNALLWALFFASPLVPLLDRCWPGTGFSWRHPTEVSDRDLRTEGGAAVR